MSTTKSDVRISFTRMAQAAAAAGLDVAGWQLQPGSASNGISWSIITGRGGASDVVGLPFGDQIGKTAADAERTLDGMAAAFESVTYAQRRNA